VDGLTSAAWHESSYSGTNGGNWVEVARNLPGVIAVRDSKNPSGQALIFTPDEWNAFLSGAGEFDAVSRRRPGARRPGLH
jgi:hypothetical protein